MMNDKELIKLMDDLLCYIERRKTETTTREHIRLAFLGETPENVDVALKYLEKGQALDIVTTYTIRRKAKP